MQGKHNRPRHIHATPMAAPPTAPIHHFLCDMGRYEATGLRTIPYVPALRKRIEELNPDYGKLKARAVFTNAAVLCNQLEWTYARRAKPKGSPFYKFISPSTRKAYRVGDSFLEELGWGQKEFYAAFSLIGVRYPSHTLFKATQHNGNAFVRDDGREMLYAAVYDALRKYISFYRNHALLDCMFDNTPEAEKPL